MVPAAVPSLPYRPAGGEGLTALNRIRFPTGASFLGAEDKVNDATRQVESGAKSVGSGVEETAKGVGRTVSEGAKKVGDRFEDSGRAAEPGARNAWDVAVVGVVHGRGHGRAGRAAPGGT